MAHPVTRYRSSRDRAQDFQRGQLSARDPILFEQGSAATPPPTSENQLHFSCSSGDPLMRTLIVSALAMVLIASRGDAQGALSTQGLGYPPGQMSARAEATGGAVADFDALSLVSPAAIAGVGSSALFFQYSPEFRRVTAGFGTDNTTKDGFPLVVGGLPLGQD